MGTRLARGLLITNFVLLLALIGPGSSHSLYLTERRLGVAHIIVRFLQVWFIASTILATVLFIQVLASKSAVPQRPRPTRLDWSLLLGWWTVLALCCIFVFMMGMGG